MNEIETKNYTTYFRGRAFDNVVEYTFTCRKSLNLEAFDNILKANNIALEGGWVSFIKKQLSFKSGKVIFQHIAKFQTSVN